MPDPVVIVTGANGGIGQVLCDAFGHKAWRVIATDRHDHASAGTDDYVALDLARAVHDAAYRDRQLDVLRGLAGDRLDCLINNAAVQHTGSLETLTDKDISESFDVNTLAPMILVRDLLPMLKAARGSVINVLSIHSSLTKPGFSAYSASKAALSGMTRALSIDLAPDVRINGIAPAAIATPMLEQGFGSGDQLAELKNYHPSGDIGSPQDVAEIALFLAASSSRFLNGTIVGLDGGIAGRLHDPD